MKAHLDGGATVRLTVNPRNTPVARFILNNSPAFQTYLFHYKKFLAKTK